MKDQDKSKKQLVDELVKLRRRLAGLEKTGIKHKEAAETLHENQERYAAFFDRSLCCICVYDFEGRIFDANKSALNLLGYTKKELLSLSLFSLIEEDQRPDAFKTLKEIKQTGSQKKHSEYKLRRKDGGHVWVETEASVIYREGKPYAIQSVGRDITARKRTEEDLQETKNRLHSLFEGIPVGLYRSTPEGKRLEVNRALLKMVECQNREAFLKGNVIDDYVNPEDRKKWQTKMERKGIVRDFEAQCRRQDGTVIWIRDSARTVRDSEGRILYYEGAAEDITERKKAEEKEKQYARNLAFLSRTAMEFVELSPRSDIYKFIGKRLRELVGNSLVLVNSFDETTQCIQVQAFLGVRKEIESILKILVKSPIGKSFPINEEARAGLTTGRLVKVPGGLYVLSFEKIPKHICNTLEKHLNLGDIYTMGITKEGKIFGNAVIITRDKAVLEKGSLIETFIGQASVALQRRRLEEELKRYQEHLEELVEERTAKLKTTNEQLQQEITERKGVEEALQKSEEKLKAIIKNVRDVIFQLSPQGFIQYLSPNVKELYGWKLEDLIGKHLEKTTPMSDVPKALKALKDVLAGKVIENIEINQIDSKGKIVPMEINITPIKKEGKIIKIQGVMRDITERKRAEEALRESEEKFRLIFDSASEGILFLDTKGNILAANPAISKISGLEPEEILGKNFIKLLPRIKMDVPSLLKTFKNVFQSKPPTKQDWTFINQKGEKVIIFAHYALVKKEGKVVGLSVIVEDISERIRAEMEIRKLSSAVEQSIDGIAICDLKAELAYVNYAFARMHGYSPEEMVGMKVANLHNEEQMDDYRRTMNQIKTKSAWISEIGHIRKDGTPFPTFMSVTSLKGDDRKPTGILTIVRDITSRKKVEMALAESESKLRKQKSALEQKNIALREVIAQIEVEKRRIKDDIETNVTVVVSPILEKLKMGKDSLKYVNLLQHHIERLTSSFSSEITRSSLKLTPREIEVCNMVKGGLTSKDISNLLSISHRTVEKHRRNIRKKIGISNKDINLTSFLRKF